MQSPLRIEGLHEVYVKFSQLITKKNCGTAMEERSGHKKESQQKETSEWFPKVMPRKFGTKVEETTYQRGGVLNRAGENREIEYKSLTGPPTAMLRWKIMEIAKMFICACLNAVREGIIYFGVGDSQGKCPKFKQGEILGLNVEHLLDDIGKAFQIVLDHHIKSDAGPLQKVGEQDCVNLHFVPVVSQERGLYVIEIEVCRDWKFCEDRIYYCKTWIEIARGPVKEDEDTPKKKTLKDFYKIKDRYDDVAVRTYGSTSHLGHHICHFHVKKPLMEEYFKYLQGEAKLDNMDLPVPEGSTPSTSGRKDIGKQPLMTEQESDSNTPLGKGDGHVPNNAAAPVTGSRFVLFSVASNSSTEKMSRESEVVSGNDVGIILEEVKKLKERETEGFAEVAASMETIRMAEALQSHLVELGIAMTDKNKTIRMQQEECNRLSEECNSLRGECIWLREECEWLKKEPHRLKETIWTLRRVIDQLDSQNACMIADNQTSDSATLNCSFQSTSGERGADDVAHISGFSQRSDSGDSSDEVLFEDAVEYL